MTDTERQKYCAELRTADELAFYWRKLAAEEIERLAEGLEACHGYADECETKINFLSDQINNLERRSAW